MAAPDLTQRKRIAVIAVTTLLTIALVIADIRMGGRPDPPALRAAAYLLNGAWRFHTGDDPHWASPATKDTDWDSIDLTASAGSHDGDVGLPDYVAGWMAHGHPGYRGYAWYRRVVTVPSGRASWDILGPTLVENGYELYWNGQLLGGSGRLGVTPRLAGTRPMRFPLPADAAGNDGILAVRVYMLPAARASADGGGLHSAPILAPRPVSDGLHRAQWDRTIAGYIVDLIEPIAMLALMALCVASWERSDHQAFLVFAVIALALTASRRLNNAIVAWTDLQDLTTYAWLASVMWIPTVLAWALAWNRWCIRPRRSIDWSAVLLAVGATTGVVLQLPGVTRGSRLAFIGLFAVIGASIVRNGAIRPLALLTLAFVVAASFGGEFLDPLGVPGIWFPFGIGVSRTQYLYAIVVPLLACLIALTVPSRSESVDGRSLGSEQRA